MSDILVVLSSESWGALKIMVKEHGGTLRGHGIWGDGHPGETLQQFLDAHLKEMSYDENCHILTAVTKVELETRCPYSNGSMEHRECGWTPCIICGRGDWAHPDVPGFTPHEYAPAEVHDEGG